MYVCAWKSVGFVIQKQSIDANANHWRWAVLLDNLSRQDLQTLFMLAEEDIIHLFFHLSSFVW